MYRYIIRPVFFLFSPEAIHHFVFQFIKIVCAIPGVPSLIRLFYVIKNKKLERKIFGITFSNPVGLAAGFDKDAKLFDELSYFGFGFVEIGTITPLPQPGNDKPRMFRLPKDKALINRMGFNNEGAAAALQRLRQKKSKIIIGGNIGKNKSTLNEEAVNDYEKCFETLFNNVDFFVLNVSSPNTPGLRQLQDKEPLTQLLARIKELNSKKNNPKPILLKIAPDLTNEQLDDIISIVLTTKIDGVVATNTTINRSELHTSNSKIKTIGAGGLSGKPLFKRSIEVIRYLCEKSGNAFPIIGVGGVHTSADAIEMLKAGAALVQVYTGFIYEGPAIAKQINKSILKNGL